jgi:prevent-host-death family protein
MKTVSVRDARSHLKALLDRVAAGEEIVIVRRGKAAARLVPAVRKRRHPPDLTAFRATIRLKGEPVSVTVAKAREEERH